MTRRERVFAAFAHREPDRTPLFEIFQPYQPIHWPICGRTIGTDEAMAWDAMADGVAAGELIEAEAHAAFRVAKFFELDMVRLNSSKAVGYRRPVKLGEHEWERDGVRYVLNPRTELVVRAVALADSRKSSEEELRCTIESWDCDASSPEAAPNTAASGQQASLGSGEVRQDPVHARVRELAAAEGIDWVYMAEIGAGTGVAFYPPFMLMWMLTEPNLFRKWIDRQKATAIARTRQLVSFGDEVVALGGDVSSDKGPFISPATYREFILPVIQEHVAAVHECGALAVYTSDGNHWAIKREFFFDSGVDGYKEVDRAAGMTMDRLIEEGIDRQVCIIGNIDARHTLCRGKESEVRDEVIDCLRKGQTSPGGHILHASHSVHEDVKPENYLAAVNAYRDYFGMPALSLG